jgi:HK97 family phage prohead protease
LIRGYAAVFNEWAEIIPGLFREQIAPGAFRRAIKQDDVRALVNHDPNYVLGRNTVGTLSLREDKRGLAVEITPPDTQWARDLMVSMKRGDISQMSFGFRPSKWTEDRGDDDLLEITLKEARLFDVSVVTFPAYPQTAAWARSTIAHLERTYLQLDSASPDSAEAPETPTSDSATSDSAADSSNWQQESAEINQWLEDNPWT